MFSQNMLYYYAHVRINLNNQSLSSYDEKTTYNCICSNKLYVSQQNRVEHEKNCDENVLNGLITEEDWLKLLTYYDIFHIKNLKQEYKQAYDKIKHMRNKKFLKLLDKISHESLRFDKYLNNTSTEYVPLYWSTVTINDFIIET